ncbi:MAG: PKD domain-containing protein, partial [Carboxydocellales bacterium]
QLTTKVNEQKIITTATDLSPSLDQLADTIITSTPFNYSAGPFYLLQGQAMAYSPSYSDYENDPKVADNWYISHNPSFLDNNTGFSIYNNQTVTSPVNTLDKVGKYSISYKAQDDPTGNLLFAGYKLWSNPAPTTIIVHRKPIASFTLTPGTISALDSSYDPDFQFSRSDKGIIEWKWMWKKSTSATWTMGNPSGIPAVGNYNIHLEVKDVYGVWSDPVEKTVTVVDINKPPVVNFSWAPALIYEGDSVAVTNLSTDAEGDPLTYQWTTYNPAGVTNTLTTPNITLTNVVPGTYWITLRVWDSKGATGAITKSFSVGTLGVIGYVEHTQPWNANRIKYNQSKTGTDDAPRPYDVFFAVETFVLKSVTTDTGLSSTKANSLQVVLLNKGETEYLTSNINKTEWLGGMTRSYFENLADGNYTFRFTATYTNGVVKTYDVTIKLKDSWLEYYNFHRTD